MSQKNKFSGHLAVKKNKRIKIFFRDGSQTVDRFLDRRGADIQFLKLGWLKTKDLRSIAVYKGK